MVRVTAYVHQPVYNYSHKYRNLDMITKDVQKFMQDYNGIILHKDPYRGVFHSYLREIRTKVKQLLLKFGAIPYDDGSAKTEKELFCCGLAFHDAGELRKHYKAVHNEPFIRYTNALEQEFHSVKDLRLHHHSCRHKKSAFEETDNCELKSALVKLAFFNRRVNEYLQYGTVADRYLCLYLKKILKKIMITLDTFAL
ncbi:uncharacterized protein LOC134221023 isoform X1 [Armigeres subalbatus]|uniref:uncharacterized protein LOC134221023 isoform X1 n=2 Tax=Armigeres subalbatus TaxID=124917 RepID=UPI002ED3EDDB